MPWQLSITWGGCHASWTVLLNNEPGYVKSCLTHKSEYTQMLVLNVYITTQSYHHKTPNTLVIFHYQFPGFRSLLFWVDNMFFRGILTLTPVEYNYYVINFHRYVCFNGVLYTSNCIFNYRFSYICRRTLQKFSVLENCGMITPKISVRVFYTVVFFF